MIYQLLGLVFLLMGCSHLAMRVEVLDKTAVSSLQNRYHQKPWLPIFREIWFFGRTSFTLVTLLMLTTVSWKLGGVAILVFLVVVGIEQIIKAIFKRSRPFSSHQDIRMLQPIKPHDPSFPSGDALRVWYLALILPVAVGGSSILLSVSLILAILVSLGRSTMGVHYPTDIIAGIGLGFIGAGTTIWMWQFLGLL